MKARSDGSVQSSATPTYENAGRKEDNSLYRCMVTKVLFTDDPDNITSNSPNPRVLYDVVVLGGFSSGQVISNCRLSSSLGGNFNFYERTLRASSENVSKTKLQDNDGDVVYVQFVQGHQAYPVIVALDEGINTGDATGAAAADGQVERFQYNGIYHEIDKNGDFTWIRKGGEYDEENKFFTPEEEEPENVKLTVSDQLITLTLKNGLTVTINGNTDKIDIVTNGGAKASIDGENDKVDIETAGGAKVEVDGNGDSAKATTSGGPKAEILGSDDKVVLEAGTIELGEGASEKIVLGDSFKTTFDAHTHPTAVGPSGPPTTPMPGSDLSDVVKAN